MSKWISKMSHDDAKKYFDGIAADLKARFMMLDRAEEIYDGPGRTQENSAVSTLMHACDYLGDRIGYEMDPHPKGMIRLPAPPESPHD